MMREITHSDFIVYKDGDRLPLPRGVSIPDINNAADAFEGAHHLCVYVMSKTHISL